MTSATLLSAVLRQIARRGNLAPLFRLGLQPSQVVALLEQTAEEGLTRRAEDGAIELTELGYEALARMKLEAQRFTASPLDVYRQEPLPPSEPFLPRHAPPATYQKE